MMSASIVGDDVYGILGFNAEKTDVLSLTDREIATAYRKQALKYHPDKNPDDPVAAEKLARVFLAYETLRNPDKRKIYDDSLRAVAARQAEAARRDVGRRRMREDLERRERAAAGADGAAAHQGVTEDGQVRLSADMERKLQKEIEELRTEIGLGPSRLSADREALRQQSTMAQAQNSTWAEIPGFSQWFSAQIEFDDLEAAVLARAKGQIPSGKET